MWSFDGFEFETPGLDRGPSCESYASNFSAFTFLVCTFLGQGNWYISCLQNIGEVGYTFGSHQHFTCKTLKLPVAAHLQVCTFVV
jgi:hypothetical protein